MFTIGGEYNMANELDYKGMGFRIKGLRLQKGIHQIQLAKSLDISQTHMSNIESGRAGITLENLVKMCDIFGCDLSYIVYGDNHILHGNTKVDDAELLDDYSVDEVVKVLKIIKAMK